MFENLIESKPKAQRTLGQSVLSVVVHGAIIFGAVKATQGVAETIKNRPVDTTMVFLKPPPPPPRRPISLHPMSSLPPIPRRRGSRRWWRRPTSRKTSLRSI